MGVRVRGKATARPKKVEDPAFNEERGVFCLGPESLGMRKQDADGVPKWPERPENLSMRVVTAWGKIQKSEKQARKVIFSGAGTCSLVHRRECLTMRLAHAPSTREALHFALRAAFCIACSLCGAGFHVAAGPGIGRPGAESMALAGIIPGRLQGAVSPFGPRLWHDAMAGPQSPKAILREPESASSRRPLSLRTG